MCTQRHGAILRYNRAYFSRSHSHAISAHATLLRLHLYSGDIEVAWLPANTDVSILAKDEFAAGLGVIFQPLASYIVSTTLAASRPSCRTASWYNYSVSQKHPPEVFWHLFRNGCEFLVQTLLAYYTFLSTLECKFLFNYLQLWQSYAILSATTQCAFRPKVNILSMWWWSRLIWHNFVKVADNWIKICSSA